MKESIFDHLKKEHDEFRTMMSALVDTYDARMFSKLAEEIEKHMEAEEHVLYRRVRNEAPVHALVLEGVEEHSVATHLLRKMQHQNGGTETWMAKMTVLEESVLHHLEHEEKELFPKAAKIVSADEAVELNTAFEKAKKAVHVPA